MLIPFPTQNDQPFARVNDRIFMHKSLQRDLDSLLRSQDEQLLFMAQFQARLGVLADRMGTEQQFQPSWFEIMKDEPFRVMKFRVVKLGNLRILYCIEGACAFLLYAFKEKKTAPDYRRAAAVAATRRKDLEGVIL